MHVGLLCCFQGFFFFNDTATTEIYTLSLHDALPIYPRATAAPFLRLHRSANQHRAVEHRGCLVAIRAHPVDRGRQQAPGECPVRPGQRHAMARLPRGRSPGEYQRSGGTGHPQCRTRPAHHLPHPLLHDGDHGPDDHFDDWPADRSDPSLVLNSVASPRLPGPEHAPNGPGARHSNIKLMLGFRGMNIRAVLSTVLLLQAAAHAQSLGGTITGVVTDAAYQPIPSASVQLTQAETGRRRNVVTDAQGGFTIRSEESRV